MFALFDLDDTVHDKTASLKICGTFMFDKFLKNDDIKIDEFLEAFVFENCIIQPKAEVFSILTNKFSISLDKEPLMLEHFDSNFHKYSKRFEFVIESMKFLQSNCDGIACVTNGRDFFQRNKIEALGLNKYFDVIVTSGELGFKKPNPLIFETALKKLGASANECVFIGDNLKADMQPAKNLDMKTIWVSNSTEKPEYVDEVLSSYSHFKNTWGKVTKK